jgi:hypothetical protein
MKCIVLLELAAYSIDNGHSRTMLNMNTCCICAFSSQVPIFVAFGGGALLSGFAQIHIDMPTAITAKFAPDHQFFPAMIQGAYRGSRCQTQFAGTMQMFKMYRGAMSR